MIVDDIYIDARTIIGVEDDTTLFRWITDAVEILANEGQWDPLTGYITVAVQAGGLIVLPTDVETPLRINLDNNPSFARSRMFEFAVDGPGSFADSRVATSWEDRGDSPMLKLLDGSTAIEFRASAVGLFITGYRSDNSRVENYPVPTGYDNATYFTRVDAVSNNPGAQITLYGQASGGTEALYNTYGPKDLNPLYRVLRISPSNAASARIMYRRKTFKISSNQDYIPLHSRVAVLRMLQGLRSGWRDKDPAAEAAFKASAISFLQAEQASRNAAMDVANGEQVDTNLETNIYAGTLVTVRDVYDDAATIFGKIGRPSLIRKISDAVELLSNKGNWDPLRAYLTMNVAQGLVTLPEDVETVLRVNVDANPVFMRSQLYEFSLMGPDPATISNTETNWQDAGDSPVFFQPATPSQLVVQDDSAALYASGFDTDNLPITDFTPQLDPSGPLFARITSIRIAPGALGAIELDAQTTSESQTVLGVYSIGTLIPSFRQIRIDKPAASARILFRKRVKPLRSIDDIIFLNNRSAIVLMMQAMAAWMDATKGDAVALEARAVQALQDEQAARNSGETLADDEQDAPALGNAINTFNLILAGDVYDDAATIFGKIGKSALLRRMSEAVETLSNKGSWDALTGYVTVNVSQGLITLPPEVETVVRVNVDGLPVFMRSQLYEFSLMGPDANTISDTESNWSDAGDSPVFLQPSTPSQLRVDNASVALYASGTDANGGPIARYLVTTSLAGPVFASVEVVTRDAGNVVTQLFAGSTLIARYAAGEIAPSYRQVKLDKPGASAKCLFRRRTKRITSLNDVIFLNNRTAIVQMMRAMKLWETPEGMAMAQAAEDRAVQALQDEQASRNIADGLAASEQNAPALGRGIHAGDLVTPADIFDDVADVVGKVGKRRLLDWITNAVEALAHEGNWDPLLAYIDLPVVNGNLVTLPKDVQAPLRINISGEPSFARSRLYEFSINGPGANYPTETAFAWEDRGTTPLAYPLLQASRIRLSDGAIANSLMGTGIDVNTNAVVRYVPTSSYGGPTFGRIDGIQKDATTAGVMLYAESPGETLIGSYASAEQNPMYRQIRLNATGQSAHILYRRKTKVLSSLSDIIPLNSRLAVVNMVRSLYAASQSQPDAASQFRDMAVDLLNKEQASRQAADALAAGEQMDSAMGLNIFARDVVTVGDIYDEVAAIAGPIGKRKLFDMITDAVDMLANKAQWDSEMGMLDVTTGDGFTFALPREIGDVLEVNICGQPARGRNRWIEFHLNGPGQFDACCQCRNTVGV